MPPSIDGTKMSLPQLTPDALASLRVVEMGQPEGQGIAREPIAKADVLIENFRPGTMEGCEARGQVSHPALSVIQTLQIQ